MKKDKFEGLPKIGDFQHKQIIGEFKPSLEGFFPTTSYFGLVQDGTYLYGTFCDDEGRRFIVARKILPDSTAGLNIYTTLEGSYPKRLPRSQGRRYAGIVTQEIIDDEHVIMSASKGGLPPFELRRRVDSIDWTEGDLLSIHGRLVGGGGLQMLDIGPDGIGMYVSHLHYAEGTILGRPVRGFFGWDAWYYPPGVTWLTSAHYKNIEVAWFTLGNLYDDGTMDVAQIGVGAQKWRMAMMADEHKTTVMTTDVDAEIEIQENGYPSRILYKVNGEEWEWKVNGELRDMRTAGFDIYMTCEGIARRVGDTRKPVLTLGWIDFFADSLERFKTRIK